MANYNNGLYLDEAIQSVLKQTFVDWELLIVDDRSNDNSVGIIKKYLQDSRIRLFRNVKNAGYTNNLIKMVGEANAEIVGIIDSDDVLDELAVEVMCDVYDRNKNIGFAWSQFLVCDEKMNHLQVGFCAATSSGKSNLHFHHMNHFKTFRKSAYFLTSGYDNEIIYAEDIDLWLKLEEVSCGLFVDKCLYYYRMLPNSQSHGKKKNISGLFAKVAKYNAYARRLNDPSVLAPNVSLCKILWELSKGLYLSIITLNCEYFIWFLGKIYSIFLQMFRDK